MTGWRISAGYSSTASREDVEERMFVRGKDIAQDPQLIAVETLQNGSEIEWDEPALTYAERFKDAKDLTIRFVEQRPEYETSEDWVPCIRMSASGGDPGRSCKEETRRAFVRLLMLAMHSEGLDIDVSVG